MSDLLMDLVTYFVTNSLVTADGTDIFRDTIPESPNDAVAIYEYPGHSPIAQIDGADRLVQVVARSLSPTAAKTKARELYASLGTTTGIIYLTPQRWCTIYVKQVPFKLKVDGNERVYYAFNVSFTTYVD